MSWVFVSGPGAGVQSQVESYKKKIFDASLLSTEHFKVRIKSKVEQLREWSWALPYTSM